MNCADCRRAALIDPNRLPPEAEAHLAGCPECRALLADLRAQDAQLAAALQATRREGLQERLVLAHRLQQRRRRFGWAMAAGVTLGSVGLAGWVLQRGLPGQQREPDWATAFADHFLADPEHLRPADPAVREAFAQVLARVGGHTRAELPRLVRACICEIHHQTTAHLTFELHGMRAVAFVLAHGVPAQRFEVDGWAGEIRPVPGGAAALVAPEAGVAHELGERLAAGLWLEPGRA